MFARWSFLLLQQLFIAANFLAAAGAYVPQEPLVEPLAPIGIRISIPHDEGISLVAFHVKFNEEFNGLEAGTIARDIVRRKNERWTYEDRSTVLRTGDVVHYWIHVVYNGLGYNLVDQRYTVADFYDYKGQRIATGSENNDGEQSTSNPSGGGGGGCVSSSTTRLYDLEGNSRYPCAGQLLYETNFRDMAQFRRLQWTLVEQFADAPDYEFVIYRDSQLNFNVRNGLTIQPKLLRDEHNDDFVRAGKLTLNQCTGRKGTTDCAREATGWSVLPAVTSSRINTRNAFNFEHGRVEIRAKLPRGDWIYPLLMLEPTNSRGSLQIRIASANGNAELKTAAGRDISGHVLWGGATGLQDLNRLGAERIDDDTPTKFSDDLWSERFHTYELIWSPDRIVLRVDGQIYDDRQSSLPRNTPFYLTLGVAVGGLFEFPDNCTSGDYGKPWRNVEAKALYRFHNSTELWYRTWQAGDTSLSVDYVKIWAL